VASQQVGARLCVFVKSAYYFLFFLDHLGRHVDLIPSNLFVFLFLLVTLDIVDGF
jgi:hypothetical protein